MSLMEITDFGSSELDAYARLSEAELSHYNEPHEGMFIAESPKVIERGLDKGYVPVSFLMERKHAEGEMKHILSRCTDVPVYTASEDILQKLTGFKLTRGALAVMKRKPLKEAEEVCKGCRRIAVLENVMNPTNIGAIFRSAAALGMDCVLLTKGCADPLYRRSIRVSMGTVFQVPWTYIERADDVKKYGYKTAAMALRDDTLSISDPIISAEEKLAVVLGTEGEGLFDGTIKSCDYTVKIPMYNGVDSLNVAAASAVAFWELSKKK